MKCQVCVVGSANVDLTFRTPRFPRPGETLMGRSWQQGMGGKGANQAVAAAKLGSSVCFVARVGNDPLGMTAIRAYQEAGVRTEWIQHDPEQPTGTAAIIVDDEAENSIIVISGANACLSAADVKRAAFAIQAADVVVCQLETPVDATWEAFRLARSAGKLTVLTPAPVVPLPDELYRLCDVCVPNRNEIEMLVGHPVHDGRDAAEAAKALRARGVKIVALTLGSAGAFVTDGNIAEFVPAVKVQAVDTTGAGDAFAAALAVALGAGQPLVAAARRASVVAALTVTRIGTQAAFPSVAEVDQFTSPNSHWHQIQNGPFRRD